MVIKKLHQKTQASVDAFIEKGGKVSKENDSDKWIVITLRLPQEMSDHIYQDIKSNHIGQNRNGWILESIQGRLKHGN